MTVRSFFMVLSVLSLLTACGSQKGNLASSVDDGGAGIVGGQLVSAGSRVSRSVVALYGAHFGLCSGTIISNNAILTAAHCVPKDPAIRMMVVFSTTVKNAPPANVRPVSRMYVNPKWGTSTNGKNTGDLAVMKFSGGLPSGYMPVGFLPVPSLVDNGSMILLSGFGVSDGVAQSGSGVLRDTASVITNVHFSQTEVQVNQTGGRGSCEGDSGGPAFITYQNAYYLWGVVSRGDRDCSKTGIYTNALVYMNWIQNALQSL